MSRVFLNLVLYIYVNVCFPERMAPSQLFEIIKVCCFDLVKLIDIQAAKKPCKGTFQALASVVAVEKFVV